MGLVMDGLMALTVLVITLWLLSLGQSRARDTEEVRARRRAAQAERAQKALAARKGVRLRCLACQETFLGPVPPDGCPRCHLSTLILTEAEYQRRSRKEV